MWRPAARIYSRVGVPSSWRLLSRPTTYAEGRRGAPRRTTSRMRRNNVVGLLLLVLRGVRTRTRRRRRSSFPRGCDCRCTRHEWWSQARNLRERSSGSTRVGNTQQPLGVHLVLFCGRATVQIKLPPEVKSHTLHSVDCGGVDLIVCMPAVSSSKRIVTVTPKKEIEGLGVETSSCGRA